MKTIKRRDVLKTAAAMVTAGAAGNAVPASAQGGSRTPFTVAQTFVPIAGTDQLFPVRRIYCIGRNYAAHAREMGSDPSREPPFFFQKPTDAIQIVPPGETVDHPYPSLTKNYHYEVELVAALIQGGIWLKVNGQTKQNANLNQMIWNVAEQIANLSRAFELMPGDIIYSGTPENVGPVLRGDVMDAHIDGLPDIRVKVV